jgi:hypothetical protein
MQPLKISSKIDRPGFMLAADSVYFNQWCKILYFSIRRHAPWAHCHFHVFDATAKDLDWLSKQDCSYTHEITPESYATDKPTSVLYWSAARYIRFPEIYTDNTPCIDLDADSVMVNPLSQEQFLRDLERSWVPTRFKKDKVKSLASAVGFGMDDTRHDFVSRLKNVYDNSRLTWALDQQILDTMIIEGSIQPMDLRYTNFRFAPGSYIWTGKGDRVESEVFKRAQDPYRGMI